MSKTSDNQYIRDQSLLTGQHLAELINFPTDDWGFWRWYMATRAPSPQSTIWISCGDSVSDSSANTEEKRMKTGEGKHKILVQRGVNKEIG